MARMYSDEIQQMTNEAGARAADRAMQERNNRLERAKSIAALQESGYQVKNGGIFGDVSVTRDPNASQLPQGFVRVGGKIEKDPSFLNPLEKSRMALNNANGAGLFGNGVATDINGDASPIQSPSQRLAMLSPENQSLVKGMTSYDIDPASISSRTNMRGQLVGLAKEIDPTFDQTQYPARAAFKKDFTSGKRSQNILSANTLLKHMGSLEEPIENVPTSRFGAVEAGKRYIANKFNSGGPESVAMTKEDSALTAVAGELSNIFKQSGSTDQEIASWLNGYDRNSSRENKQAYLQKGAELMQGRINSIGSEYERTMGKPYDKDLISPEGRAGLDKINGRFGQSPKFGQPSPVPTGNDSNAMFANNGKQRIKSLDGGQTWQAA